jgi:hypothetical protein
MACYWDSFTFTYFYIFNHISRPILMLLMEDMLPTLIYWAGWEEAENSLGG